MPDDIAPEDREKLAKMKFKEWFNESFEEVFGSAFDKRVTEAYSASGRTAPQPTQQQGNPPPQQQPQPTRRRRSLLEECFSEVFHMS